ncbi:NUDIX hydrolase [Phytohabitans sp. ZYX-F-186]|uniref:NUDIX hydrolase n=1 Tax=Phytohabitans maris TaxID=3071409 RepID=A0ABU0ZW02_9ACTN|nr:NUDIX hydrolase [Phytohabitans sp. ZYX-F-186]MDQ7911220.1 NUDIX hydrolase [Phytohabitans sp. ZYX-F-186]
MSSDTQAPYRVTGTREHFQGALFSVVTDTVRMPDGTSAVRDYLRHMGAVCVVAIDDEERVVMLRQYRHPVREVLWEVPAGLLDVPGEDPSAAAARELAEEAGLTAARWELLITIYTTPGIADEKIRIFLARDLSPVGPEFAYERVFEEATMTLHRIPLDEVMSMMDRGEITNGVHAVGLLAAWRRLRAS